MNSFLGQTKDSGYMTRVKFGGIMFGMRVDGPLKLDSINELES